MNLVVFILIYALFVPGVGKAAEFVDRVTPSLNNNAVINPSLQKQNVTMLNMTVKFLDVDQGDAIFIEYPNGQTALVDAGRYDTTIDAALKAENITHIDTFIASHPDADHIGGAQYVIENYGVTKVFENGQLNHTLAYLNYQEAILKTGAQVDIVEIGEELSTDENVSLKVLFVDHDALETNDGSIVLMLSYGTTDILLTGDAGKAVEEYLLKNVNVGDLDTDILKVAHHGATTGTTRAFIDAVSPTEAILQFGYNLFGLPNPEVVNDVILGGAKVYSTHDRGTITVRTDGNDYTISPNSIVHIVTNNQTYYKLRITERDLVKETAVIKNFGNIPVKMTGWVLLSNKGKQTFTFPDDFVLAPGESVIVSSGPDAVANPPYVLRWTTSNIWNDSGDAAKLYDPFGELIHQLK